MLCVIFFNSCFINVYQYIYRGTRSHFVHIKKTCSLNFIVNSKKPKYLSKIYTLQCPYHKQCLIPPQHHSQERDLLQYRELCREYKTSRSQTWLQEVLGSPAGLKYEIYALAWQYRIFTFEENIPHLEGYLLFTVSYNCCSANVLL